jgi:hypothetical protein
MHQFGNIRPNSARSSRAKKCMKQNRMMMSNCSWPSKGKTVSQLIRELQSFEDQEMEVRISVDGGETSVPISLVGKVNGRFAMLENCEETPSVLNHHSGQG